MRRIAIVLFSSVGLGGCVTAGMEDYVGHPIEEVARRYGMPQKSVTMADGERRYTWSIAMDGRPGPPPPTIFRPIGKDGIGGVTRPFVIGGLPGGACLYALDTAWDAKRGHWIVTRMKPPRIDCL
ncbi:MAG: hypothetical protein JWO65_1917 [Sphingomonas bacterium]|jgi:hypothetical protein|nr:hypothetical protein [Sphingomonas bacterium]